MWSSGLALVLCLSIVGVIAGTRSARALVTPQLSVNASTGTRVGLSIRANATLAGGASPSGTLTFNLFGPGDNTCTTPIFTFTVTVNGNGTYDAPPFFTFQAGTYRWTATYSGDTNNTPVGPTACLDPSAAVSVDRAVVVITTTASPPGPTIHDTASIVGGVNPTGTITFVLSGPGDTFCSAAPMTTSTKTVNGNGSYDSPPFTPTVSGTYKWRAIYSGDANNLGTAFTPCLDPAESVVVAAAPPVIVVTSASPGVTVGAGSIFDTATLSGGTNPTGTIVFRLFGPDDATCSGPPVFVSAAVSVNGAGTYPSPSFTPTLAGTYRWRAAYSGDVNNAPVPTACGDPAESVVVVAAAPPVIVVTSASPGVTVGAGSIFDTATLSGGTNPTGTIVFRLFGPDDATCSGPPVFVSAAVSVNGAGTYPSPSFTPTLAGTYRWRAAYSGDVNNAPVATACGDPAESVVVAAAAPVLSIGVDKTASPLSLPEPGGTITFTIVVTNPSNVAATVSSMVDDVYGDLNGRGTCTVGAALGAGGGTYTCQFPGQLTGVAPSSQTDTVTVVATDGAGNTATASDNATVTLTNVAPATPTIVTAASAGVVVGGAVHDTAVLTGGAAPTGSITFRLFGPDDATCSTTPTFVSRPVPVASAAAVDSPSFTPTAPGTYRWTAAYSGDANNDPVATGCNDSGESVVVTVQSAESIRVDASAEVASLPEPGGTFTGRVSVTNTGTEAVNLTALSDDDLNRVGTCSVPQPLAPGASYSCVFPIVFTGNAGDVRTVPVTATASDASGHVVTATGVFLLSLTNVVPSLIVAEVADPATLAAPGGTFRFGLNITNTSHEPVTVVRLVDDVYGDLNGLGTCRLGVVLVADGGTFNCSFEASFTGGAGDRQTDTVTATVVDDDSSLASGSASATVALSPAVTEPTVPTVPPTILTPGPVATPGPVVVAPSVAQPLARTGTDVRIQATVAALALLAGVLMLAVAWCQRSTTLWLTAPGATRWKRRGGNEG